MKDKSMNLTRKKVYDPLLRFLHWTIALSLLILLATAWSEELFEEGAYEKALWQIHIYTGYVLSGAFALRLLWGFVGPKHARFKDMWHPRSWLAPFKKGALHIGSKFGHHPMASLTYLGLYLILLAMIGTGFGLAAIEHSTGPFAPWLADSVWLEDIFEEPHELLAWLVAGFIGLHIVAMIVHERIEKVPVSQAMLSGYQYRFEKGENDETDAH